MKDRFGNQLHENRTVLYFSTNMYHTIHIGVVLELNTPKGVKLLSDKNREIHRPANTLIVYTGMVP